MKQLFISGSYDLTNPAITNETFIPGGANIIEWPRWWYGFVISTAGVFKHLRVNVYPAPRPGDDTRKYEFIVVKNGTLTLLRCTIKGSELTGENLTNEVSVVGGDILRLQIIPTNNPNATMPKWSLLFEGDNEKESLCYAGGNLAYYGPTYANIGACGQESLPSERPIEVPIGGTFKNLYCCIDTVLPVDRTIIVRKNGVNTALQATIPTGSNSGTDTVNTVHYAQGDRISIYCPDSGAAFSPNLIIGFTFQADVDGQWPIFAALVSLPGAVPLTRYNFLEAGQDASWSIPEGNFNQLVGEGCRLWNFYIRLLNSPGVGKSRTFRVRKELADTTLALTIADAQVANSNLVDQVIAKSMDSLCLQVVSTAVMGDTNCMSSIAAEFPAPVAISINKAYALSREEL